MIKIFSFAGSCAGAGSKTKRMSDVLADAFRKKAEANGDEVSYECMTGADLRVDYCRSCLNCFINGSCPLDQGDDMPVLRQKILDCDILFFGSPVYLWSMSGIAKSVLDRLGYWTHSYELFGKPCVVFSTTDNSYGTKVADDLETILGFTGAVIVNAGYAIKGVIRTDPNETALRLMDVYRSPASGITEFQQSSFFTRVIMARKAIKETGDKPLPHEVRVLAERGITKYVVMSEAVEALCPGKK